MSSMLSVCPPAASPAISTLSLHDALPICLLLDTLGEVLDDREGDVGLEQREPNLPESRLEVDSALADRKSTRLNSSHQIISYAVFCLKKKNIKCKSYTKT